eukprot:TRINITY_DN5704_c3_g1_i3.p1 TRINITY_DN5704_c3_g1~~TRINITY_DN5704_c3_g1_i3.p1  ORF type:complete len:315 (-),score=32.01 TRINITY_DN5704_c3_g1_i3:184-1128(-)
MGMNNFDFRIFLTVQVLFIPITVVLECWLRHVNEGQRALGFFKFSNEFRRLLLFPYILLFILGVVVLRLCWGKQLSMNTDTNTNDENKAHLLFSALLFCQSLGMLGILTTMYIKVVKHNSSSLRPDYYYFVVSKFGEDNRDSRQKGRDGIGLSDVIEYLSRHNHRLCREVARLRTALDSNQFWDPKYVQDLNEMKNSLEAAYQRVRLLESEKECTLERFNATMDRLQERDAEILKLQQSRVQFVDEYQRLRESLEEWSNRNAKLERKYNSLQQQRKEDQDSIQRLEQQLKQQYEQQQQYQYNNNYDNIQSQRLQ